MFCKHNIDKRSKTVINGRKEKKICMNIEKIIQKLVEIYAEQEGLKITKIQIERRECDV